MLLFVGILRGVDHAGDDLTVIASIEVPGLSMLVVVSGALRVLSHVAF